jgi:hypothetical protein
MPPARWYHLAAVGLVAMAGCANLEARKVPLPDRLSGTDDRYKGFRYYLSRPYIVVSRRVCVSQQLVSGKLMENARKELFIETIDEAGRKRYLDIHGQDQSVVAAQDETLTYVRYAAAASQSAPPDAQAPGKAGAPAAGKPGAQGHGGGIIGGKPETVAPPAPKPPPKPGSGRDEDSPRLLSPDQLRDLITTGHLADAPAPAPAPPAAPPPPDTTPPPFQFVMLPDFEEQMAVKDCNFAARGKYEMHFADGWQLRSVGGAWDATEVAVKALQVLSDAVSATAAVRQEQLNKLPVVKKTGVDVGDMKVGDQVYAVRVQATYIEPGLYRIRKSSEKGPAPGAPDCPTAAILADLGLPTVADVQTYLLAP